MKANTIETILRGVVIGVVAVILICLNAVIAKFAWNVAMPYIFSLPTIGYGKALALCFLSTVLFGRIQLNNKK
jgi:hypothetical protein